MVSVSGENCDDTGILSVGAMERHRHPVWGAEPLPSYTGLVEPALAGKIGIACSGGGIRSASFSLGALQVLQREGVLEQSCYLAAVSGGSYIASAFCMVRKTWTAGGGRPEQGHDGWDDSDPEAVTRARPPFFPGSPEEQYLRNRSSYMAPGIAGKMVLAHRLVVGLLINLGFFALFLTVIGVGLSFLYGALYPSLAAHVGRYSLCGGRTCDFTPLVISPWVYLTVIGAAGLAVFAEGVSMVGYSVPTRYREVADKLGKSVLVFAASAAVLLIGMPLLLSLLRAWGTAARVPDGLQPSPGQGTGAAQVAGVGFGSIATVGGALLLQFRADWLKITKLASDVQAAKKWYTGLGQTLQRLVAYLIAAIAGPILALSLVLLVISETLQLAHPYMRWIVFGVAAGLFGIVYFFADLNTWSLHSFYRRRLSSAFALKRLRRDGGVPPAISSNEAGFAAERAYNFLLPLSETAIPRDADGTKVWPTLVVCAAANVSDSAATPPGRSVTSFTFSARAMGGPLVGAVETRAFEEACDRRQKTYFTLPAAVAMSGAAISPSMGKQTRRPMRFLMTIANVRLGVWVPNPRHLRTFDDGRVVRFRRPRPSYLLLELLGLNRIDAPFLYVTDGGHYENLGLVELLRRGCTEIYVFDASKDRLDAFGDAVSLARSELNVKISVDTLPLVPDATSGLAAADCVTASVTYPDPDAPPGRIYFARAVMTADLPADVVAYHARDPHFPQDSTADQLYLDQRFEAYRALGGCAATHALEQAGRLVPGLTD
ncbi:MAG: hypothetical protein QOH12_145 [Solirubrobacteraceae bacterium]|nr:hypothetical protein [Solirubrobacteraceae bacterium]